MASFTQIESLLKKQGFVLVAGIDEAGRGPMAGPVVCAAVILKDRARLPGLDDSKKLSAQAREKLFPLIIENSIDYAISIVSHKVIDDVNILNAVRFGNLRCIECLKTKPDMILIDGHDRQIIKNPHRTIIKGDSKVRAIAAASILAKVTRDRLMKYYAKEYNNYAFEKHVGYGTRLHRSLIEKYGRCEIHRKSFTFNS